MKCKHCGRDTHYCSSCDGESCLDEGYCSDHCWKESDEYSFTKQKFVEFVSSLNVDQIDYLINDDSPFNNCSYEYEIEEWAKEHLKSRDNNG